MVNPTDATDWSRALWKNSPGDIPSTRIMLYGVKANRVMDDLSSVRIFQITMDSNQLDTHRCARISLSLSRAV